MGTHESTDGAKSRYLVEAQGAEDEAEDVLARGPGRRWGREDNRKGVQPQEGRRRGEGSVNPYWFCLLWLLLGGGKGVTKRWTPSSIEEAGGFEHLS